MDTNIETPNSTDGRLPAEARIGKVRLRVADLERALGFYRDVLGLRLARGEGSVAALSAGDGPELVELHEHPGALPAGRRAALGLYHHAVLLPGRAELGAVLRRLHERGWALHGASDHAVSEALYTADADGIGVEIYADRPRSAWRWSGGELYMTTQGLEIGSLVRDAAPPSDEIAPGTTIGHVHFHVGDLDHADAFFRRGLGMDLMVGSYPGARFYAAGGYHHHVGANTWAGPRARPAEDDHAGLIDWELVVPAEADASAVAARLRRAGFSPSKDGDAWKTADASGIVARIVSS